MKIPPPLNFTFNWDDQQRYWGILKSTFILRWRWWWWFVARRCCGSGKSPGICRIHIYILYVYMYMCVYNYMCIYIYIIYPFKYSYHDVSLDILKQVWLIVSWYIILTHTIMSLSLRHINDEDHGQVEQCNMKPCPLARLDRATDAMLVRW